MNRHTNRNITSWALCQSLNLHHWLPRWAAYFFRLITPLPPDICRIMSSRFWHFINFLRRTQCLIGMWVAQTQQRVLENVWPALPCEASCQIAIPFSSGTWLRASRTGKDDSYKSLYSSLHSLSFQYIWQQKKKIELENRWVETPVWWAAVWNWFGQIP